jgi:XisI protein
MDTVSQYRQIIEEALRRHAESAPGVQYETVFDRANDHYLLVQVGWGKQQRIYGTLAHVDLVGEKVWIQSDGTESGLAEELHHAGIPSENIVLGYRLPEIRKHTGYAVA